MISPVSVVCCVLWFELCLVFIKSPHFGFKNGKLVSVLHSVNGNVKKAVDCNYYITEPQEVEKQIEKWKQDNSE